MFKTKKFVSPAKVTNTSSGTGGGKKPQEKKEDDDGTDSPIKRLKGNSLKSILLDNITTKIPSSPKKNRIKTPEVADKTNSIPSIKDPFNHIPIIKSDSKQVKGDKDEQKEEDIQQLNKIINYIYTINQPLTLNEIVKNVNSSSSKKDKNNNQKDNIKQLLGILVKMVIISEVPVQISESITVKLYVSQTWYKLNQYYIINMIEQSNNIKENNNNNNIKKQTTMGNHLSKSPFKGTTGKSNSNSGSSILTKQDNHLTKRKHATMLSTDEDRSNETKPTSFKPNIYPLNSQIEEQLYKLEQEKKNLLVSIQNKQAQLDHILEEEKNKTPTSKTTQDEDKSDKQDKEIKPLIDKWKEASKLVIDSLQEKMKTMVSSIQDSSGLLDNNNEKKKRKGRHSDDNGNNNIEKPKVTLKMINFKKSNMWNDQDEDQRQSSSNLDESFASEDGDVGLYDHLGNYDKNNDEDDLLSNLDVTSKLYIMKTYGLDPKVMEYDEESDSFIDTKPNNTTKKVVKK